MTDEPPPIFVNSFSAMERLLAGLRNLPTDGSIPDGPLPHVEPESTVPLQRREGRPVHVWMDAG